MFTATRSSVARTRGMATPTRIPDHYMSTALSRLALVPLVGIPLALVTLSSATETRPAAAIIATDSITDSLTGKLHVTSAMRVPRAAHTATLLYDGRVLVAGGFSNAEAAEHGAELYDPASNRFASLPRMVTTRHSHSATRLANGKVLIVGGYATGNAVVSSVELFDPATKTFAATGALRAARGGHAAVLLDDGKVLIAGGVGPGWSFLSSAELYDPASGTFAPTGAMTVARESHVAVRLQDGRVLVIGGHRDRRAAITIYASAELYDAASGTFRSVGDMRVRRHKHDAVLLNDGRVLVTGGADERDGDGVYNSTEFFDPSTLAFTPGPAMQRGRYKHQGSSLVLSDGRVLVAGGAAQAETFDPVANTFTLVGGAVRMAGQFSAAAPLEGGAALITGGYGPDSGPRNSAWVYSP